MTTSLGSEQCPLLFLPFRKEPEAYCIPWFSWTYSASSLIGSHSSPKTYQIWNHTSQTATFSCLTMGLIDLLGLWLMIYWANSVILIISDQCFFHLATEDTCLPENFSSFLSVNMKDMAISKSLWLMDDNMKRLCLFISCDILKVVVLIYSIWLKEKWEC